MIDAATGWIEIRTVPSARTELISNQVELAWLTCYTLLSKGIVDRGIEFLADFRETIIKDYCLMEKSITSGNP